jgi:hypothetical protein
MFYTRGERGIRTNDFILLGMVPAAMAAIFVCEGLYLFIMNPQSDRVGCRNVNLVPIFWFLAKIQNRGTRFIVLETETKTKTSVKLGSRLPAGSGYTWSGNRFF